MSAKKSRGKRAKALLSIHELVRMAEPVARDLLEHGAFSGLDPHDPDARTLFDCVQDFVEGKKEQRSFESHDDLDRTTYIVDGAYAIGIAVGLMLRPKAFARGGK